MKKKNNVRGGGSSSQDDAKLNRPRALFLLLLLTSFMALALWALEVRPSLPRDRLAPPAQAGAPAAASSVDDTTGGVPLAPQTSAGLRA